MDSEGWIVIHEDGFLGYNEVGDDGDREIFHRSYGADRNIVIDMNMKYFETEPKEIAVNSPAKPKASAQPAAALPKNPIQLNPAEDDDDGVTEVTKFPIEVRFKKHPPTTYFEGGDQEISLQKKIENEFADMNMESTKSNSRGFLPQIDLGDFEFQEKAEHMDSKPTSPRKEIEKDEMTSRKSLDFDIKQEHDDGDGKNLNIWKKSIAGIGALCSIGVAAATMCIFILGRGQKNKLSHNLRFQFYTDDKRMKHVVHHANKLNEAISAVRGVPLNRAQITFGGYYDGL